MGVQDYGLPGETLRVPQLSSWAQSVADAIVIDGPISDRFAPMHGHEFLYYKAPPGIVITDTVFVEVGRLTIPAETPSGVYMWGVAFEWSYPNTNNSVLFRVSNDGGASWHSTYVFEPSDRTDRQVTTYVYPKPWTEGTETSIVVQAALESNTADDLTIHYFDMWIQRAA